MGTGPYLTSGWDTAGPELSRESPKHGKTIRGGLVVVEFAVKSFKIVDFTKDLAASESKRHVRSYNTIHRARRLDGAQNRRTLGENAVAPWR